MNVTPPDAGREPDPLLDYARAIVAGWSDEPVLRSAEMECCGALKGGPHRPRCVLAAEVYAALAHRPADIVGIASGFGL